MATVNVTIAGKSYRMACGDGEEAHLAALAAVYDARIEDMRQALGELGDMRLHVMAALTLADEMAELRAHVGRLEERLARAEAAATEASQAASAGAEAASRVMSSAAERIQRVARSLAVTIG